MLKTVKLEYNARFHTFIVSYLLLTYITKTSAEKHTEGMVRWQMKAALLKRLETERPAPLSAQQAAACMGARMRK